MDHISFDVARGEVFGFLGANGAGKTTAMRMLCGLSRPTSGTGTVAGFDITRQHEKIKRNIGYMSQKFSLYEDLKVWENIRLYAGIYGMKDAEIARKTDELLERLDFTRERNTMVQSLPLGWKRSLAFSVSIFHDPAIVFLDEPTGGVDPYARRQFWEIRYTKRPTGVSRSSSPPTTWTRQSTATAYPSWWTDASTRSIRRTISRSVSGHAPWRRYFRPSHEKPKGRNRRAI